MVTGKWRLRQPTQPSRLQQAFVFPTRQSGICARFGFHDCRLLMGLKGLTGVQHTKPVRGIHAGYDLSKLYLQPPETALILTHQDI